MMSWFQSDISRIKKILPADAWEEFDEVARQLRAETSEIGGLESIRALHILMCLFAFDAVRRYEFELSSQAFSAIHKIFRESFAGLSGKHFILVRVLIEAMILNEKILTLPAELGDLFQSQLGFDDDARDQFIDRMFFAKKVRDSMLGSGSVPQQIPQGIFIHLCWGLAENNVHYSTAARLLGGMIDNDVSLLKELRQKSGAAGLVYVNSKDPKIQAILES